MPEEADRAFEKAVEGRTIDELGEARLVSRGEDEQVAELPMKNVDQNWYQEVWGEDTEGQRLLMSCPKNIGYHQAVFNTVERRKALNRTLHAGLARKLRHWR